MSFRNRSCEAARKVIPVILKLNEREKKKVVSAVDYNWVLFKTMKKINSGCFGKYCDGEARGHSKFEDKKKC